MTLQIFPYEYFVQKSMELNRKIYKLPEYSQKQFHDVKRKLNIRKEIVKETLIRPTTLGKQEEVVATLFKVFNKITEKTYDKLSVEAFSLISQNISEKEKICSAFFQVILNNSFFCHLYAKLYKGFIEINDDFSNILEKQTANYVRQIESVVYISPSENYDQYCDYVKEVEGVKNFTNFLIQCLNENILENRILLELAITFQSCCLSNIDDEEKLLLNEIYVSNIAIIVKDSYDKICESETWSTFVANHETLMKSQGCGKNKKMHFKLLDVSEQIVAS